MHAFGGSDALVSQGRCDLASRQVLIHVLIKDVLNNLSLFLVHGKKQMPTPTLPEGIMTLNVDNVFAISVFLVIAVGHNAIRPVAKGDNVAAPSEAIFGEVEGMSFVLLAVGLILPAALWRVPVELSLFH